MAKISKNKAESLLLQIEELQNEIIFEVFLEESIGFVIILTNHRRSNFRNEGFVLTEAQVDGIINDPAPVFQTLIRYIIFEIGVIPVETRGRNGFQVLTLNVGL